MSKLSPGSKHRKKAATNTTVSNVAKLELSNKNEKSKSKFKQKTFLTSDDSAGKLKLKNKSGVGVSGNREVTKSVYKGVKKEDDGSYKLLKNRTVKGRNKSKEKTISKKRYERIKKRMKKRGDKQINK
jgi:hypothetical protein|tara:strand:+ start:437 stop:820 length:384 start_codon:yes stop_codon:yes gene_type:complete